MAKDVAELMRRAWQMGLAVPQLNICYLPMVEAVVAALRDTDTFGQIAVSRPDWEKLGAGSPGAVAEEYSKWRDERYTRLHLDHVPVIDEDGQTVPYLDILRQGLDLGYESIMVDGSRLPLAENIACTRAVVDLAHAVGVPVEAELGAVLGHESGPLPPYEELFASGRGFTDPAEAAQFVRESGVDWLSVSIGNVHGALVNAAKTEKVQARLSVEHLRKIRAQADVPLVLHGGSGVQQESLLAGITAGISKVNIGTALRRPYEMYIETDPERARQGVYDTTVDLITNWMQVAGSATKLGTSA